MKTFWTSFKHDKLILDLSDDELSTTISTIHIQEEGEEAKK